MRLMVDASVLSLALRRRPGSVHPTVERLRAAVLGGDDVFVPGIVLQEVLQGVRDERQFVEMARTLAPWPTVEATRSDHVQAARLVNACLDAGHVCGTIDALIATLSIVHRCHLLAADADFTRIATVVPLRLA